MKIIDTHCHLHGNFAKEFQEEGLKNIIKNSKKEGIEYIILASTTIEDSKRAILLSKKFKNLKPTIGIHPSNVSQEKFSELNNFNFSDVIAIGETGIDLYHENNPSLEKQVESFIFHIELALKHNKPIIIHSRNAEKEIYDIVKNYPNLNFVLHSYTGSLEMAHKFVKMGGLISFSGIVTFKNAKEVQNVFLNIPKENILIETDAPFLSPTPFRGKINKPYYLKHTALFIIELRKEKDLIETIYQNSLNFFKI